MQMLLSDLLTDVDVWMEHDATQILGSGRLAGTPVAFVAVDEDDDGELLWLVASADTELLEQARSGQIGVRVLFTHGGHLWLVSSSSDGGLSITPVEGVDDRWLPTADARMRPPRQEDA